MNDLQRMCDRDVARMFRGSDKPKRRRQWRGMPAPEIFLFRCGCADCKARRPVDKRVPAGERG